MESVMADNTITKEYFIKRLSDLCVKSGLSEFPKDEKDQHILLKSAVLMLKGAGSLSEKEVNDKLETWVTDVSNIKYIDRVTLRRRLVDTGYLTRSKDGAAYQVVSSGSQLFVFDPAIDQLDPLEVIVNSREEIARRKREYMEKNKGNSL
jgi:hypothetical protein